MENLVASKEKKVCKCRVCSTELNKLLIDLGSTPLANSYVSSNDHDSEKKHPLAVYICEECLLAQLNVSISPEEMFEDYSYFSSYSTSWLLHTKKYVTKIINKLSLNSSSFVTEIASNDGYLLQYFIEKKIPVLGIEPAKNIASEALKKGINTKAAFFNEQLAYELSQNKKADLIIANNVLAHVPDLNGFIKGLKTLLHDYGTITIEFPHLMSMLNHNEFDTIYHEHHCYFSLISLNNIFKQFGLNIYDVEKLDTHGGSLRIYAQHSNVINEHSSSFINIFASEIAFGLDKWPTYNKFSYNVGYIKNKLLEFLYSQKQLGKKIAAYGAPAKGNTLLNYCGIDNNIIEFTVDKSIYKQGKLLPGSHIPIYAPNMLAEYKPDIILILAWNLKAEIIKQIEYVQNWGCKIYTAIPEIQEEKFI